MPCCTIAAWRSCLFTGPFAGMHSAATYSSHVFQPRIPQRRDFARVLATVLPDLFVGVLLLFAVLRVRAAAAFFAPRLAVDLLVFCFFAVFRPVVFIAFLVAFFARFAVPFFVLVFGAVLLEGLAGSAASATTFAALFTDAGVFFSTTFLARSAATRTAVSANAPAAVAARSVMCSASGLAGCCSDRS